MLKVGDKLMCKKNYRNIVVGKYYTVEIISSYYDIRIANWWFFENYNLYDY